MDKRYNTLNDFLRNKFGEKTMKISLDGGFSCPNRDGTISSKGCIFCSERGSGDFAGRRCRSISEQFDDVKDIMNKKWKTGSYIAYFQAFTNTYDTIENLKSKYDEAIENKGVVGLAIATRPDCIDDEVADLIASYKERVLTWVELGFQSSNEKTAEIINRGYRNEVYEKAVGFLKERDIPVVTHLILGLPGEEREDIFKSLRYINSFDTWGIKFHLLYLIKNTPMVKLYEEGNLKFMEEEEYLDIIAELIARTRPSMIIHRLTGDAPRKDLIGPMWSLKKWEILNAIDEKLIKDDLWQGKFFKETGEEEIHK